MMKGLERDEPFEVAAGCPTITFELTDGSLMLAWSAFASGILKSGRIDLTFSEWTVEIEGVELNELWKLLQLQDLRLVRPSSKTSPCGNGECQIRKIAAEKVTREALP